MTIKKDVDFFTLVREANRKYTETASPKLFIMSAAAIVLVLLLWLVFSLLNMNAGQELSRISAALSGAPKNSAPSGEQLNEWQTVEDFVQASLLYKSENALTAESLKLIFASQPEDLRVLSFKSDYNFFEMRHVVSMDCSSSRELCGADFAQLLRQIDGVSDVNYNGVASSGRGYSFTISFKLSSASDLERNAS